MLKNLAQQQDLDVTIREMKNQEQLPNHYKVLNGILFRLVRQDWKIVLTNEMLQKLIQPAHESLAYAAALKCYLSLREDFTINNVSKNKEGGEEVLRVSNGERAEFTHIRRNAEHPEGK